MPQEAPKRQRRSGWHDDEDDDQVKPLRQPLLAADHLHLALDPMPMLREVSKRYRRTRWDDDTWPPPPPLPQSQPLLDVDLTALDLEGAVVFKILTFLPLHKIYELRIVCKAWNSLLRSPAFLRAWSSTSSSSSSTDSGWLVMVRKKPAGADEPPYARQLLAYDLAAARWMSLDSLLHSCPSPALSILGGLSLHCIINPFDDELLELRIPTFSEFGASVAGAPGLVCFLTSPIINTSAPSLACNSLIHGAFDPFIFSVQVVNLLTGSHHNLPPPFKHCKEIASWQDSNAATLLVSMQSLPDNAYRVFLHHQRQCFPGPLEIYDSRSGRWKAGKSCVNVHDAKIGTSTDVERADFLKFLGPDLAPFTLFAYRVESAEWSLVNARFPCPRTPNENFFFPSPCYPIRYGGRIFVAALRTHLFSLHFRGFVVWELQMRNSVPPNFYVAGADWVEVSRTPMHLWSSCGTNLICDKPSVKVISSGSVICITVVGYREHMVGRIYLPPPFVYNLVDDSWNQLPSDERGNDFLAAFALQPNFIATA